LREGERGSKGERERAREGKRPEGGREGGREGGGWEEDGRMGGRESYVGRLHWRPGPSVRYTFPLLIIVIYFTRAGVINTYFVYILANCFNTFVRFISIHTYTHTHTHACIIGELSQRGSHLSRDF